MSLSETRKELKKYLGKNLTYTGILLRNRLKNGKTLIIKIRHKGKVVAGHIWVTTVKDFDNMPKTNLIEFSAVAETYRDSHGVRKYGLKKCFAYKTCSTSFGENKHDAIHKRERCSK